jgi:hypothetical protein
VNKKHIIQREMTITHDDFFRLLPRALENREFEIINDTVLVKLNIGTLKISLTTESIRTIGSLKLPVSSVTFSFENSPEMECLSFFKDFDLAFQKGGG